MGLDENVSHQSIAPLPPRLRCKGDLLIQGTSSLVACLEVQGPLADTSEW